MSPVDERQIRRAAVKWWLGKRPVGWSDKKHHEHPLVNASAYSEVDLAIAVHRGLLRKAELMKTGRARKLGGF